MRAAVVSRREFAPLGRRALLHFGCSFLAPSCRSARLLSVRVATFASLLLAGCASGGPFVLDATSSSELGTFRAGAAVRPFTPPKGYPLAGYGGGERRVAFPLYYGMGWPGRLSLAWKRWKHSGDAEPSAMLVSAAGTHDELEARAVVLSPEHGPPFAICRIDAIESSAKLHDRVVELVKDLGFKRETVMLAATHTHSGVGGFMDVPLAELLAMDVYREDTFERIARASADAIRAALADVREAEIGFARVQDKGPDGRPVIARNRRARRDNTGDEDDVGKNVDLVFLRETATRAPIATLGCAAVHPTVLGTQNRYFSKDLVGPVEAAITSTTGGGTGIFLNGAEGDIGPRTGAGGLRECVAAGEAFARVCSGATTGVAFSHRARFRGAVGSLDFGDPWIYFTPGNRDSFYEADAGAGKFITAPLTLPVNLLLWIVGFTNVRVQLGWNLSVGAVIDLSSYGETSRFRSGAFRIETEKEDVLLLGVPGEATHRVGSELEAKGLAAGASRVIIIGLCDDAMSYIANREEYFQGGYEATMTIFGPETSEKLHELEGGVIGALYPR